jgi:hypothetical protein
MSDGDDRYTDEEQWDPPADPVGDSGAAALAHLQAAVLEMVAASRAALDVVEKLVHDPEVLAPLVSTANGLGQVLADLLRERSQAWSAGAGRADHDGGESGRPGHGDDGVQRIRIS